MPNFHRILTPACQLMLLLFTVAAESPPRPGDPPNIEQGGNSLRVMAFNIRFDNPADGANAWANRKERVASTVRFHGADIVGMQEALKSQIDYLAEALPEYGWFGVGRDDGKEAGEFSPVFYRLERVEVLAQSTFWLSETPMVAGKLGWDAACNRVVTWGKFREKVSGAVFYLFNTHFDHAGDTARVESAKLLLAKIAEIAGDFPAVICGDFNAREDSEVYRILSGRSATADPQKRIFDCRYLSQTAHHGPLATFNGFNPTPTPGRIDYIFVKPQLRVLRHGILAERWEEGWASDHFPVLAEVVIAPAQQ